MEESKKINVHDYQPGVILTYRDNPSTLEHGPNYIYIEGDKCGKMQFCFTEDAEVLCSKRDYLVKVPGSEERLETVYDLEKVFNRETYENSKKYQDKVKRWLNWFSSHNLSIRVLAEADRSQIDELYKEWVTVKGLDESMIRRYQNCTNAALDPSQDQVVTKQILGLGMFNEEGKLLGFRTLYNRDDGWAFDLSNCVTRNDYKYLSEIFQVNTLKYMLENLGIEFYNLGLSDGSLRMHKTLLPNFDVAYYVVRD